MQISDTVIIAAPRDRVYAALTDPAVLQDCIPGCTGVQARSDDRYLVEMSIPTGLRPMRFSGQVRLDTTGAPQSLSIRSGQVGRADLTLEERGEQTVVSYTGRAEPSGRAAMLGSRVLSGVVRRIVAGFFDRLGAALGPPG